MSLQRVGRVRKKKGSGSAPFLHELKERPEMDDLSQPCSFLLCCSLGYDPLCLQYKLALSFCSQITNIIVNKSLEPAVN